MCVHVCVYVSASEAEGQNSPSVVVLRKRGEERFPFTGIVSHPPENKTDLMYFGFHGEFSVKFTFCKVCLFLDDYSF